MVTVYKRSFPHSLLSKPMASVPLVCLCNHHEWEPTQKDRPTHPKSSDFKPLPKSGGIPSSYGVIWSGLRTKKAKGYEKGVRTSTLMVWLDRRDRVRMGAVTLPEGGKWGKKGFILSHSRKG